MLPVGVQHAVPYIVIINFALVAAGLMVFGMIAGRNLQEGAPQGLQNFSEAIVEWLVGQARKMGDCRVNLVAPYLGTFFMLIIMSNLLAMLPIPLLRIPPTSFYSVTLGLALTAVFGNIVISTIHKGILPALKHLVWPNPIQLISEVSDVLSLSLRLFGNIGGEFMVSLLVARAAPVGIPLIVHALGLIAAVLQALVFTLLTSNFLASGLHHEEKKKKRRGEEVEQRKEEACAATVAVEAA